MTKSNREATQATRAYLPLFAMAGLLLASPAWAQPQVSPAPPQDLPVEAQVPPGPPAQPEPPLTAAQPQPLPPSPYQLRGYPYAAQQGAQPQPKLFEPEGPVTTWDPLRFTVALESRASWLFDSGAKRLMESRYPVGGGVSVQADVFRPNDRIAIRLDLGWITTSHTSFQSGSVLTEKLDSNLFSLGASLRYHVLRWLAPFARISGGLGWDKLRVADLHDRQQFEQGALGAGVLLRSPGLRLWQGSYSPALAVLGNLEAGYAVATSSDWVVRSTSLSSSASPIPTNSVAIGHMGRSAPYLRVSLGIAF